MTVEASLFVEGLKQQPYWWEAAPRPDFEEQTLPEGLDVIVVGSGYTGLSAALTLARAGRVVAVLEAGVPGYGASSRNAGFVGRTLKLSFGALLEKHGAPRAIAIYREMAAAFDFVVDLIGREQIDCHFAHCGRFMGALSPRQYEAMARELELKRKHLGDASEMVPRADQHREIGSDLYHGGAIIPDLGGLHPGLYQLELLDRARRAGARVFANTPVIAIRPDAGGFKVSTEHGAIKARDVIVATNGYTGEATPWLRRRIIPFQGFMIATEVMDASRLDGVLPNARTFHDYNNDLVYMRRAPDSNRLLLGALTGRTEPDLRKIAARLHAKLCHILPDMSTTRLSHVWTGFGAGTFDLYPHIGTHEGVHYAMGYCFAGVPMGTYLGHKAALRVLGSPEARTVFEEHEFRTLPLYTGRPWFFPLAMAWYRWQDRRSL